jgi:hypothetical protein
VAHYLSPAALREVAREYAMAPPQDARPGVGIETWIGARTLIAPVPSIAARRAQRAAERKAYAAARKARGR